MTENTTTPSTERDDQLARSAVERLIGDLIGERHRRLDDETIIRDARALLNMFPTVEYETTTRRTPLGEVKLRRAVVTGPWEVDPSEY